MRCYYPELQILSVCLLCASGCTRSGLDVYADATVANVDAARTGDVGDKPDLGGLDLLRDSPQVETSNDLSFDAPAADAFIPSGLVAYYPLDGTTEDLWAGRNATGVGGHFVGDRDGRPASAYYLDAQGQYLEFPNVFDLSSTAWTYSLWFRLDQSPPADGGAGLLTTNNSSDSWGVVPLYVSAVDTSLRSYNGINQAYSDFVITLGTWYQATIVMDNGGLSFYVDGQPVMTVSSSAFGAFSSTYASYYISQYSFIDKPVYFVGAVDDVRFFNRALGPDEVLALKDL